MKKILTVLFVLLFNGCSVTSEQSNEKEPLNIGPKLKLTEQNNIELWLKGTWKYKDIDETIEFKYTADCGKQQLSYDAGELSSILSYEIKENYFTNVVDGKTTITHLWIYYTDDKNTTADTQMFYREIEKVNDNEYKFYLRGYRDDTPESDYMKNPRATGRASLSGANIFIHMIRI